MKSILGHSPDLAEAAMLALGEPSYEPFVHQHLPIPTRGQLLDRVGYGQRGGPQADDALEDALGHRWGAFITGGAEQMRAISSSSYGGLHYPSLYRRRAW